MAVELMDENPTQARNDNLGAEYTVAISDRGEIAAVPARPAVERNVRRLQIMTIPPQQICTNQPCAFANESGAHAHRTVKDVVRVITLLDLLKERIKISGPIEKLWPIAVAQHVCVGIIHVAALIPLSERRAPILARCTRRGVDLRIEIVHEFQAS